MHTARNFLALAVLALPACANPFGSGWERGVGSISTTGSPSGSLVVPDTVQAGVAFTARVTTFGSSSCTRADGAEVRVARSVAEITPYDLEATGNATCTADLAPFPRDVQVRFDAVGTATVRVRGRPEQGAERVVERTVVVR